MLNYLSSLFDLFKDEFFFISASGLILCSSVYIFDNILDCFDLLGGNYLLPHDFDESLYKYNHSVFTIKNNFSHFLNMRPTDFIVNFYDSKNNRIYFDHVKTIVLQNKDSDFNFFLSKMRGNIKNIYINLLHSIKPETTLSEFLDKNYSKEFLAIFNKKINSL